MTTAVFRTNGFFTPPQSAYVAPEANAASVKNQATTPASDSVGLSPQALALMQQANDAADVNASAQERLNARMGKFADSLSDFFKKNFIPDSEDVTFHVDKSGHVTVDGAYKEKLEQYFKDNPDAAKELKTLSALSSLEAMHQVMKLYNDDKKKATTQEQEDKAADVYATRSAQLQSLSGTMTFKDGQLTSAALEYANSLVN